MDIYTVLPADLDRTTNEVSRCEQEWRHAGGAVVVQAEVDSALQNARTLQDEFKKAKARSRRSLTLWYLTLVRFFVLTRLPQLGKLEVCGLLAAITCGLSFLLAGFVFSLETSVMWWFVLVSTALGSCITTGAVICLWPTENKRQAFNQLQRERKTRKAVADSMAPVVVKAWADVKALQKSWDLCDRLDKARDRRQKVADLLSSVKYQLVHTDWRSLRGDDFEHFIQQVFQLLGYHARLTKGSFDQGVDLVVNGKGQTLAVQTKGYDASVGNHAVMEVVAGMRFYGCGSCVVITNSRFTSTAKRLAAANGCQLVDGRQIPDLIEGRLY